MINEEVTVDLALLKPKVQRLALGLIEKCRMSGFEIIISRGFRTIEEQNELYYRGRSKSGKIVTNAKGGQSFHNYGVAFDVRPILSEEEESKRQEYYKKAGEIGVKLGLEWGGNWQNFVDLPHFQYTAGYTTEDFAKGSIDENLFK